MGVFPGLTTGASSMKNASNQIQVIGNNLANVSTNGFKRSRALSTDAFYSTLANTMGQQQVGNGANPVTVQRLVSQGNTTPTGNPLDAAIEGAGFFVLADPTSGGQFFTRDGSFSLDNTGTLIHGKTGHQVQGFPVTNGVVGTTVGAITIPTGANVGQATTTATFKGNLDATAPILGTAGSFQSGAVQDAFHIVTGTNDQIVFDVGSGPITASLTTDGGLTSGTTATGTAVASALKTALEATNGSADTYTVTYNQTGDVFTITNDAGNGNSITFRHSNAASTGSNALGFLSTDSSALPPTSQLTSDVGVAFNILTGVNDTLDLTVDGTPISITIPTGNYTGSGLAFQMERQIHGVSNDLRGTTVSYGGAGSPDRFTVVGPRTGGAHTINQPSNTGTPTINVAATSTTVTGGTLFNAAAFNTGSATAGTGNFDPSNPFQTSTDNFNIDIIDSLGEKHSMSVFVRKVGVNQWEWHGAFDGGDLVTTTSAGTLEEVASGRLIFNSDGLLDTEISTAGAGVFNLNQISATAPFPTAGQTVTFDFGTSITTDGGTGDNGMVQFGTAIPGQTGPSNAKPLLLTSFVTDGVEKGDFTGLEITTAGDLDVRYTNGQTLTIARLGLALFPADENLSAVSDNLLVATADSGAPVIQQPNTQGAGKIIGDSLETSNVDLANEFVELILAQQIFQANARLITTSDEILQTVTNI